MLISLFSLATCLVERLTAEDNNKTIAYVVSDINTVHFIQCEIRERAGNTFISLENDTVPTRLSVYKGESEDKKALLYRDEKSASANTFFFTTPEKGTYSIILEAIQHDSDADRIFGIDCKIFPGEANRPSIVSTNDVEVSKAEVMVENSIEFVRKNMNIQGMDEEDGQKYKQLYEQIMKMAVCFFVIKLLTTGFTLYYSNKMTKKFYASQGLGTYK